MEVDSRSILSDHGAMKGNEFIKRTKKLAKMRGVAFEWCPNMGKGSHGMLFFGDKLTVVRNPKDELKTGTLHAMLSLEFQKMN